MRSALLLAATLAAGLMAGLFAGFAYAVMPGLAGAGDATFVEAMNQINVAIVNPLFLLVFLGGPVVGLVALVLERRWAVAVGFALSVVMLLVTMAANVPLNDALAAGKVTRSGFEGPWDAWNVVRALAGTGSLVAFGWALLTRGSQTVRHR
ncbi:MAG: DUF1772 domain-containing protein [Nonomuraea sp.]|nr:DUF1772 domain-containing protein [Nonomuraea sp.]NUS07746.1 DUF1772 domain-containing protein [Nonomuraea sp.]